MKEPTHFNLTANPEIWMLLWGFHCFPPSKCKKLKCFLAAGRFWATGDVSASQMATTATFQERLMLREVAPIPSFQGRMHTWITEFCWAHPYTVSGKGLSRRPSPGWEVLSKMVQKDTSSLSEKNKTKQTSRKRVCQVSEQLRWLPEILLWKHHEKLLCDCVFELIRLLNF